MPRIPTYTAEGRAAVAQFPQLPASLPQSGAAALAEGVAQTAAGLGGLAGVLRRTQDALDRQADETELVTNVAVYDAGIRRLKTQVFTDPEITDPKQAFFDQATALQTQTRKGMTRPLAQRGFDQHVARKFPDTLVDVEVDALKRQGERELAAIEATGDLLSTHMAEAQAPEDREAMARDYGELLKRAEGRGLLTAVQRQQKDQAFIEQTTEKNAEYWRRTDRLTLFRLDRAGAFRTMDPAKKAAIIEHALKEGEAADTKAREDFNRVAHEVYLGDLTLANQGLLTDARIETIAKDRDPFVRADKAGHLQQVQNNPLTGRNTALDRIMEDYALGPRTVERVVAARAALNQAAEQSTRRDPRLAKFGAHLQAEESEARSALRGERATVAQEVNAGIRIGTDLIKSETVPSLLGGPLGNMTKGMHAQDLAEFRLEVQRRKAGPAEAEKIAREIIDRRNRQQQRTAPSQRDLDREILNR